MNARKLLIPTLILVLLFCGIASDVRAESPANEPVTVGGVDGEATKSVLLFSTSWATSLYSQADSPINIIGYTYWTFGEYCPSTSNWASYWSYGGDYDTYDSYYASYGSGMQYQGCNGISRHRSLGNHDFAHGGDHEYPYVEAYLDR